MNNTIKYKQTYIISPQVLIKTLHSNPKTNKRQI